MTFLGIYFPSRPTFRLKTAVMRSRRSAPNPASLYGNMIDETETRCRKSYPDSTSNAAWKAVGGLPQATLAITAETDSSRIP
jgi:hypothetical protein